MASLCQKSNGSRYIQFSPGEVPAGPGQSQRPKISLGRVTKKQAATAQGHIENLCRARKTGTAIPNITADWLETLGGSLRSRLEVLGLVEPREKPEDITLHGWVSAYIAKRQDIKPNTRRNMEQAEKDLQSFFNTKQTIGKISPEDAEDFRRYLLGKGLAEATVRRRCKRIKQFMAAAVKKRLLIENPFDDIPTSDRVNKARQHFISKDDIYRVIDACPDAQWRLIFALARFGGLRMPSELLPLTWEDVNWSENKILIHSPKTEHIDGKESRLMPLFPELLPYLQEAFDLAEPGQKYVITRFRHKGVNLGTQAHRIIKQAGLKLWPKTFQNLRASRETELVENFPVHVVTDWLGNSPDIAKRHYLQTTEEHFLRAVSTPWQVKTSPAQKHAQGGEQNRGHKGSKNGCRANPHLVAWHGKHDEQKSNSPYYNSPKCGATKKGAALCEPHPLPLRGLEPRSPG